MISAGCVTAHKRAEDHDRRRGGVSHVKFVGTEFTKRAVTLVQMVQRWCLQLGRRVRRHTHTHRVEGYAHASQRKSGGRVMQVPQS